MARSTRRDLSGGTRQYQLGGSALVLLLGLWGTSILAASLPEDALRATLAEDWQRAAQLWRQTSGPQARKYEQQAQEELRQHRIRSLLAVAGADLNRENWNEAVTVFQQVLRLDPYIKEAQKGLAQGSRYLNIHQQLEQLLKDPEQLFDPVGKERARAWLARHQESRLHDRKLARGRAELERLLAEAEVPVPLTLTSDGKSMLEIYRVGQLGRVTQELLELPPGDYVVVAIRKGFRDERVELQLRPGKTYTVDVRCKERI